MSIVKYLRQRVL